MICLKCKRDHLKKNTGPLTTCELNEWSKMGGKSNSVGSDKYPYAFGSGNRFQFKDAK